MAEFFYFNHSVASRSHPSVQALIKKYGVAGYGHYFMLLEEIYASHKPILRLDNELLFDSICDEHKFTSEELESFINDCCALSLFDTELWQEARHLTSNGIIDSFNYREKKSQAGKKGGRPPKQADEKAGV